MRCGNCDHADATHFEQDFHRQLRKGYAMPTADDFQKELSSIFSFAKEKHLTAIIIKSGDLHRLVGGYPGSNHRMPVCCNVMRKNIRKGDEVLSEPPSGEGATLTIKYHFPRK